MYIEDPSVDLAELLVDHLAACDARICICCYIYMYIHTYICIYTHTSNINIYIEREMYTHM